MRRLYALAVAGLVVVGMSGCTAPTSSPSKPLRPVGTVLSVQFNVSADNPGFHDEAQFAQEFTAPATGALTAVSLKVAPINAPTPLHVAIADPDLDVINAGGCDLCPIFGPDLAGTDYSGPGGWVDLTFGSPVAVHKGQKLAIRLSTPASLAGDLRYTDYLRYPQWEVDGTAGNFRDPMIYGLSPAIGCCDWHIDNALRFVFTLVIDP